MGQYKLINPLLECELDQSIGEKEYSALESKLRIFIKMAVDRQKVQEVAVYFRDLNNGPWFGINERANFSPASLLKLPIMMAYFKKAETDPTILTNQITFNNEIGIATQRFLPTQSLEIGKSYSVQELIEHMIDYSDNQSLFLLEQNHDSEFIFKTLSDLGMPTPSASNPDGVLSVKEYASLFRVLYNASYLSYDFSEKALNILSGVSFEKGIVAGVGKNVVIAHKFGEREVKEGLKQLHDCGIVYTEKTPYLICIMTRGSDFDVLSHTIENISRQVHTEVLTREGKNVDK